MKQTDRFLLAIVAGIGVLVVVALTLALTRSSQGYLPETTPGGVAHNFLLALKQRDDERAYGYLSPELAGYPPTIDEFGADVDRYSWNFNRETASLSVGAEQITDARALVTINETRFYQGGLFGSSQYTNAFDITLRRQGDAWKIVSADAYWVPCWTDGRPCE
jgi:hypothetical protein